MGDDDNDFEERFALKVKPDTRIKTGKTFQTRGLLRIIMKRVSYKKNQKQNKEKKNER